jgi:hypothetical protein
MRTVYYALRYDIAYHVRCFLWKHLNLDI